ncbi:MAG: PPC domain-containing protein [Pirellulales bacterium]
MTLACAIGFSLGAASLFAELPSPRFDVQFPLGANAGSTVTVEVVGNDIEGLKTIRFEQPGFSVKPVEGKEKHFEVQIASDVPAGTYDCRLVGRFGLSNPRLFAVTHGLSDVAEVEPNNDDKTAQKISINQAVNGRSDGNDQDVFRISLKAGQRITAEAQAAKMQSGMDGVLTLYTAEGTQLAANGDYYGRDPLIDFIAPKDGEYLLVLSDLSFRGGFAYRFVVSDLPQIENAFPTVVEAGKETQVQLLGRNLGSASKPSAQKLNDLPLDTLPWTVSAADSNAARSTYRFLEHPTRNSVLASAATCTMDGFQIRPTPGQQALNPFTLLVSESPVTLEQEGNNTPETAQAITFPAMIAGRFNEPRDADWYSFSVEEAGRYGVEVYCERIDGQADPYVLITDEKGNRVNELDDFGHRINAFDGHLRDPSGFVDLQPKQSYRLLVQDRYRRGGPRYQYAFSIRKERPDFFVAAIHSQNPGPSGINLWRGGAVHFDVIIHQRDNFRGPLTITAEGLPPGLHSVPTIVQGNTHATFVIWADENAPEYTGPIKLVARGKRGDEEITREVRFYNRSQGINDATSVPTREAIISVFEKAPYALKFASDKITIEAGQKADVKLLLQRIWPDLKENTNIVPVAVPGNLSINGPAIPGNQNDSTITISVNDNAPAGDVTFTVLGQMQVPYQKDPAKTDRPNTLVNLASQPITVTITQPPKKQ